MTPPDPFGTAVFIEYGRLYIFLYGIMSLRSQSGFLLKSGLTDFPSPRVSVV